VQRGEDGFAGGGQDGTPYLYFAGTDCMQNGKKMTDPVQAQALFETSDLVVALIGILGVVFGSFISFFSTKRIEKQKSRRDMSIALYNEFHSERMNQVRGVAFDAIRSRPGQKFEFVYEAVNEETKASLSIFLHFLEKIASLDKTNMVDKKLLKDLLGRYFAFWFQHALDDLSPEPESSEWHALLLGIKMLAKY
jgi:hypothetical protein